MPGLAGYPGRCVADPKVYSVAVSISSTGGQASDSGVREAIVGVVRAGMGSECSAADIMAELRRRGQMPTGSQGDMKVLQLLGEMTQQGVLTAARLGMYKLGPNATA